MLFGSTPIPSSGVNKSAKSMLAKLMATENLFVEHRQNAKTASFNTKTRVLTLPIWDNMSGDMYDGMVGHEIGHALETPDLEKEMPILIKMVDPNNPQGVHGFMNVIEDARIERMVKIRYPGMRRSFGLCYKELFERNFFGTQGKDVQAYSLIDRINIHFKLGVLIDIKFTDEEQKLVDMVGATLTWDGVCAAVKAVYDFSKEKGEAQKQEGNGEDEGEGSRAGKDGKSKKIKVKILREKSEASESKEDGESSEEDEEDADEGSGSEGDENEEGGGGDEEIVIIVLPKSLTDEAWEAMKEQLVTLGGPETSYNTVIKNMINLKNAVVPYKTVHNDLEELITKVTIQNCKEFRDQNSHVVSYMVKEFEMRKAADMTRRAVSGKTGVIDTNRLHSYQYNDDVFRRITTLPGGKSHGLVMFIDWSSSMSENIAGTIEQLLNLILFCRKVQIPFEVFGFSDCYRNTASVFNKTADPTVIGLENFALLQFFAPGMSQSDFEKSFRVMVMLRDSFRRGGVPKHDYKLNGTPLNASIVAAMQLVPAFQEKTKVQIVNTVFLTDGASNPITIKNIAGNIILRDVVSKAEYLISRNYGPEVTKALLQILKARTGTNNLGFFILPSGNNKEYINRLFKAEVTAGKFDAMSAQLREKKFLICVTEGYDEYYLIPGGQVLETKDEDLIIAGKKTVGAMAEAFSQFMKQKSINRIVLQRFIQKIAER